MDKDKKTKPDNKQEVKNITKECTELKKEKAELTKKNQSLEQQINELKKQIAELNHNFINQVNAKADQAQKILNEKLKAYQDKYQLEIQQNKKYALGDTLSDLISIINQFNSLISHPTDDPKIKNYLSSLKLFSNLFNNWLSSNHVTSIDVKVGDVYNPQTMDAVEMIGQKSQHDVLVKKILTQGYMLYDRVIVPTKVVVEAKTKPN